MTRWSVLREPTIVFLLLASSVHLVRRNLPDFLIFTGTAALIVIDSWRARPQIRARLRAHGGQRKGPWVAASGMTLFAACAAVPPPTSLPSQLILLAVALVSVGIVVAFRPLNAVWPPSRQPSPRGWQVWAVLGVAACLVELGSFVAQQVQPENAADHPALSDLVEPLLASWVGRAVFLALWGAAGWWLLRQLAAASRSATGGAQETGRHTQDSNHQRGRPEVGT